VRLCTLVVPRYFPAKSPPLAFGAKFGLYMGIKK